MPIWLVLSCAPRPPEARDVLQGALVAHAVIAVMCMLFWWTRKPRPSECCECGYSLEGLREGSVCPECGGMPRPPTSEAATLATGDAVLYGSLLSVAWLTVGVHAARVLLAVKHMNPATGAWNGFWRGWTAAGTREMAENGALTFAFAFLMISPILAAYPVRSRGVLCVRLSVAWAVTIAWSVAMLVWGV
jgi:hypothetical protein